MSLSKNQATGIKYPKNILTKVDPKIYWQKKIDVEFLPELASQAISLIAPQWPLTDFVAFNSFWGFREQNFLTAASLIRAYTGSDILMPFSYYHSKYVCGEFSDQDILNAVTNENVAEELYHAGIKDLRELQFEAQRQIISLNRVASDQKVRLYSFSQYCSSFSNTNVANDFLEQISTFCAAYFDRGQAALQSPLKKMRLFEAWKKFASKDFTCEIQGHKNLRNFISSLPDNSEEIYLLAAKKLNFSSLELYHYFCTVLFGVKGWASYIKHLDHSFDSNQPEVNKLLGEFLAVLLAYELYLFERSDFPSYLLVNYKAYFPFAVSDLREIPEDLIICYVYQNALEQRFSSKLLGSTTGSTFKDVKRKRLQALFCIDVRSEAIRNALEKLGDSVETYGFAGFFALPIKHFPPASQSANNNFPILLSDGVEVKEKFSHPNCTHKLEFQLKKNSRSLFRKIRQSITSGFSFVESFGSIYLLKLVKETLFPARLKQRHQNCQHVYELSTAEKINFALNFLEISSLQQPYAKYVMLCGHNSETKNNAFSASLDCGACGGHSGDVNAIVACDILNSKAVREGLKETSFSIPDDTTFIPAVHNTTTDDLDLLAAVDLPEDISSSLLTASELARLERAKSLVERPNLISNQYQYRAKDWSEIRPELGLLNNAAMIIAPRSRTRFADLDSRVFLHDYDATLDPEFLVLQKILTAPGIVASLINMQYFASTVAPECFCAGNKTLHNIVGHLGVIEGNGGDLKLGLPLQSIHDGEQFMHTPLRLQILVDAPQAAINKIVDDHEILRNLVSNQWIKIYSIANSISLN